jgi:hypothetical protein
MANIKAKLTPNQNFMVTNYQINAASIRLGDLFDVDATNQKDGSVIMYDSTAAKWQSTTEMDNINTIINGGNF